MIVRENTSVLDHSVPESDKVFFVDNYIEAAGYIQAMKAGVYPPTVRRPLEYTTVLKKKE